MALSNGAGAEVQGSLATVVIGGLIATFLTLFVPATLYILFEKENHESTLQTCGDLNNYLTLAYLPER